MAKNTKTGLGRGLSALMADMDAKPVAPNDVENTSENQEGEFTLPIEKLAANPEQPRRQFNDEELDDLASSIASHGIIQPIIVRRDPKGKDSYQIVAGERRWRAAQKAKLHHVPVILREMSDQELLEVAIIENIQRADLNPMEEAAGYKSLMDSFGHTQEQLSSAMGKSRSHIANLLRLMNLPSAVQKMVRDGSLSAGHARALVGQEDAVKLGREIAAKGLSVRQAESLVKQGLKGKSANKAAPLSKDADTRAVEADLKAALKMKVDINHKAGTEKGTLTVSYKNLDQLDALCSLLSANPKGGSK